MTRRAVPLLGRTVEEGIDGALANRFIKKFIDPADMAALGLFLAGPHVPTISGRVFPIDWGLRGSRGRAGRG